MELEQIIDLLNDPKKISYLDCNAEEIIIKILNNKTLLEQLKTFDNNFWEDAKKGLLILNDYVSVTRTKEDQCIDCRYIEFDKGKNRMPTLILEKKKKGFYK